MACEETKCTDNLVLPQGAQGERGPTGATGAQGPAGASQIGVQGPSGGSKIDINLQTGINPYVELTTVNQYQTLAHFIFPGTGTFTPTVWRVAFGGIAKSGQNKITMRLGYVQSSGTRVIVATKNEYMTASQSMQYIIEEINSFTGLPATASNFFVEAKAEFVDSRGSYITRFFATELRA